MTHIEKFSLSQKLDICVDKNSQLELFNKVYTIISNGGLSKEDLGKIAGLPVHGLSLDELIKLNKTVGNLKECSGLIVPNRKKVKEND